jgi:hypothetical protein
MKAELVCLLAMGSCACVSEPAGREPAPAQLGADASLDSPPDRRVSLDVAGADLRWAPDWESDSPIESTADSTADGSNRDASLDQAADAVIGRSDVSVNAGNVDGFRWELPCKGTAYSTVTLCPWDISGWKGTNASTTGLQVVSVPYTFGGDPNIVYDVTLRIRGVMAGNMYNDAQGKLDAQTGPPHFHVGGAPEGHHIVFGFSVSDPKEVYYINATPKFTAGSSVVDYTAKISIRGGATVTFNIGDSNTIIYSNLKKLVVPGIAPAPAPFNGMFAQLNVLSSVPR